MFYMEILYLQQRYEVGKYSPLHREYNRFREIE